MTEQVKKYQFGVWMDNYNAVIIGRDEDETQDFQVIATVNSEMPAPNTNEHTGNNHEIMLKKKFFKEILKYMQNAKEVHLTGTGQAQEELMKYMAEEPQFKNTVTSESTTTQMSEERIAEYIAEKFA